MEKTLEERIQDFIKEYGELREKHKLDFLAIPQFRPTDQGGWELFIRIQAVELESGIPSPFVAS